jgi:hypothetical protein
MLTNKEVLQFVLQDLASLARCNPDSKEGRIVAALASELPRIVDLVVQEVASRPLSNQN